MLKPYLAQPLVDPRVEDVVPKTRDMVGTVTKVPGRTEAT